MIAQKVLIFVMSKYVVPALSAIQVMVSVLILVSESSVQRVSNVWKASAKTLALT